MCIDTATAIKCNGGAGYNTIDASNKDHIILKRIVMKVNINAAINVVATPSDVYTWNEDLNLASMYHSYYTSLTAETTDGTKWCSNFSTILATAGTEASLMATKGFNGKTKCTWQFSMEDGTTAPVIELKSAFWVKFLFNWVEWFNTGAGGMGSNAELPLADGAEHHLGAYAVTATAPEVWFNPLTSIGVTDTAWTASAMIWGQTDNDPSMYMPGTIGNAVYYPGLDGPFKETQTTLLDVQILQSFYNAKKDEFNSYKDKLAKYDEKKDDYNTK